ncbi:MAG: gliding motility protein, partial [Flavobacterium sp.]
TDDENDGIINNVDADNDNDGITNCTESYGDLAVNLTNTSLGSVFVGDYINPFVGSLSFTGIGTPSATPITGDALGNFATEAATGKNNSVSYTATFNNPISLAIEYATAAATNDYFTASTEFRIKCPINKTLTVLNPNDQILIDTNYDGIFESGITQYSSFEIRFRLNDNFALPPGTGTFSIRGNLINSITITNINLVDSNSSRAALRLIATCVPKDSDNDGVPDQYDFDSDNDTIPDYVESQGINFTALSGVDANRDGIDDIFGTGITPDDKDNDGVPNYLDMDSDNDGIFDIIESGSPGNSTNTNGITTSPVGSNGIANALETNPDSGAINYTIADTDGDGLFNYLELDSDNDGCFDVTEAGFTDDNSDGVLGDTPVTMAGQGLVLSTSGYGVPNGNYTIAAPITISVQPQDVTTCELQSAVFTLTSVAVDSYMWQLSTDNGLTWTNLTNNTTYSGTTTATLTVSNVSPAMVGYQYRVFLNKNGNSCGLYSDAAILTTYALPVVTTPISLKQCDDDTDGISIFNLTQKNDVISANYQNETFTYFTSLNAAENEIAAAQITNPIAYSSGNASVYVRVENSNGCYRVARIDIVVSVTQIPASFVIPNQYLCDDYLDATNNDYDGISGPFNFTAIQSSLAATLPANVSIKFYKTEADFLAETDAAGNSLAIADITNYRNIGFPNTQTIWVRVDSTLDNSCFGFKTFDV